MIFAPPSVPSKVDPSEKICRSAKPSIPTANSAAAGCLVKKVDFGMEEKKMGVREKRGHGILKVCTTSESTKRRLRLDKNGVVNLGQSPFLGALNSVLGRALLFLVGGEQNYFSAFLTLTN